jgi:hypothetical protein
LAHSVVVLRGKPIELHDKSKRQGRLLSLAGGASL